MKKFLLLWALVQVLQPCSFASPASYNLPQQSVTSSSMEIHLRDVLCAYDSLKKLSDCYRLYDSKALPHSQLVATIKTTTDALRPICSRLSSVPADEIKQVVMLADAIIWQADWVDGMYHAEYELDVPESGACGLELLRELRGLIVESIQYPLTPHDESEAWCELAALFGGEPVMTQASYWLDERLAKDYKTAYYFLKDFTAALAMEDGAASAQLLQELVPTLAYLLQGGESDRLRMMYLTLAFSNTLRSVRLAMGDTSQSLVSVPQMNARREVLVELTKQLPALQSLIPLGCKAAVPSAE